MTRFDLNALWQYEIYLHNQGIYMHDILYIYFIRYSTYKIPCHNRPVSDFDGFETHLKQYMKAIVKIFWLVPTIFTQVK